MKKAYFLLLALALTACSAPETPSTSLNPNTDSPSITESTLTEKDSTSESVVSDSQEIISSESTSSEIHSEESNSSVSSESISSSVPESLVSSDKEISSDPSSKEEESHETNPDGSEKLNPPSNTTPLAWSQTESVYEFTDSFPTDFSYIYGNKILTNPNFYTSKKDGNLQLGGWKVTVPNSSARMGFQTPHFETDKKIEMRLYIGDVNNSNNKVDEDNPFMTVYGFDEGGTLIRTTTMDCPDNFYNYRGKDNPYVKLYLNGNNLSYLEVRFTAAPYKGSQCYNFGIRKIGFKSFPYELN